MKLVHIWWLAAVLLAAAEVLLPGFFLLWIGVAAACVATLLWLLPDLSLVVQLLVFAGCAIAASLAFWRYGKPAEVPASTLNRRAEQLIGQRYVLASAIENGRGKARVGDSLWLVEGPDLPAGARVDVIGVDGTLLQVQPAD
jgi:inner membrane protein